MNMQTDIQRPMHRLRSEEKLRELMEDSARAANARANFKVTHHNGKTGPRAEHPDIVAALKGNPLTQPEIFEAIGRRDVTALARMKDRLEIIRIGTRVVNSRTCTVYALADEVK